MNIIFKNDVLVSITSCFGSALRRLLTLSLSFCPTNRCLEIISAGADVLILCTLTNVRYISLLSFDDAVTVHPVEGTPQGEYVWNLSVRLPDVDSGRAIRFILLQLTKSPSTIISAKISP